MALIFVLSVKIAFASLLCYILILWTNHCIDHYKSIIISDLHLSTFSICKRKPKHIELIFVAVALSNSVYFSFHSIIECSWNDAEFENEQLTIRLMMKLNDENEQKKSASQTIRTSKQNWGANVHDFASVCLFSFSIFLW